MADHEEAGAGLKKGVGFISGLTPDDDYGRAIVLSAPR